MRPLLPPRRARADTRPTESFGDLGAGERLGAALVVVSGVIVLWVVIDPGRDASALMSAAAAFAVGVAMLWLAGRA
jgi:hypothetical protein